MRLIYYLEGLAWRRPRTCCSQVPWRCRDVTECSGANRRHVPTFPSKCSSSVTEVWFDSSSSHFIYHCRKRSTLHKWEPKFMLSQLSKKVFYRAMPKYYTTLHQLLRIFYFSSQINLKLQSKLPPLNLQLKHVLYCRFFQTMRRHNYVTPTSYLELIKTFKSLLGKKRLELLTLKERYTVGLEKLEFSEGQAWFVRSVSLVTDMLLHLFYFLKFDEI